MDTVLRVYPAEMSLVKFCQLSPNSVNIEDDGVREKVVLAIHAARAYEVRVRESTILSCNTIVGGLLNYEFHLKHKSTK